MSLMKEYSPNLKNKYHGLTENWINELNAFLQGGGRDLYKCLEKIWKPGIR